MATQAILMVMKTKTHVMMMANAGTRFSQERSLS
jgi:hypothetical protein